MPKKFPNPPPNTAQRKVLRPSGTRVNISPMNEPTPAPIAAGRGPETSAKNTGITTPGRNSPIPKGVLIKLVKPLTIAYSAAHMAAVATNLDLFTGSPALVNSG